MNLSPISPYQSSLAGRGTGDQPLSPEVNNVRNMLRESPERPLMEPFTPEASDDGSLSHGEGIPRRFESAARALACRLRTPIDIDTILNSILRVTNAPDAHELDEYLSQALRRFPKLQQSQIRSFSHKISQIHEQSHQDEDGDDVEAVTPHSRVGSPLVAENGSPTSCGRVGVLNDVSSSSMDGEELERLAMQANNNSTGGYEEPITNTPLTERPRAGIAINSPKPSPSGSRSSTATDETSPQEVVSKEPASTARPYGKTVSPRSTRRVRHFLLDQSVADFIHESYEQVQRLSLPGNSQDTYKALFDALQAQTEEENEWSDGSQWVAVVEAGDNDRCMGSIRFALTACGFAQWHQSQVRWLERATCMTTQLAINAVYERVLGRKPEQPGASQDQWKRRRQKLSTYCTRGKKWLRLLSAFDYGILFKDAWELVKSKDAELDTLITECTHQIQKMDVLGLLKEQMVFLLNTGRTEPDEFRNQLMGKGYPDPCITLSTTGNDEVDAFFKEVRSSGMSDSLLIPRSEFRFDIISLQRLGSTTWLNDDIVLACLHLSTKLPCVRVGFSIPIHRQNATRAGYLLPRPFERAAMHISEEHETDSLPETNALVWLFPLFQRENHFSLLEIDEQNKRIYHYDSSSIGVNSDVKVACNKEFPEFQYIEEEVMRQYDTHSCGLLVIKNARDRMMGRPVNGASHRYDPVELRVEALRILQSAWRDGALVVPPMEDMNRKRKPKGKGIDKTYKRQKTRTK
ncbi:unnamed protein product [Fusarium fujikuroi]|uniref:Ubiquitin-like protease family profile domain-containing protein n=1 Tax=Fusarium fujikuroi TaxID=5127 RepID=A0A9Q9UCJ6_FUSFU|nr:uncharacterized protein FFE2_04881 [Fusarium fujikuroi]SCV35356.1 uncharacterized protein FFFS_04697 [Fusarium fujikuroi]VTT63496.1 unnamed protein product [Fusarium fujikuroi]VTT73804.1 unnamed protein product [Fusarium fujikuroi]